MKSLILLSILITSQSHCSSRQEYLNATIVMSGPWHGVFNTCRGPDEINYVCTKQKFIVQGHEECNSTDVAPDFAECLWSPCSCLKKLEHCFGELSETNKKLLIKVKEQAKCGSSSLTNLGLPMILLLAVATFFNK